MDLTSNQNTSPEEKGILNNLNQDSKEFKDVHQKKVEVHEYEGFAIEELLSNTTQEAVYHVKFDDDAKDLLIQKMEEFTSAQLEDLTPIGLKYPYCLIVKDATIIQLIPEIFKKLQQLIIEKRKESKSDSQ